MAESVRARTHGSSGSYVLLLASISSRRHSHDTFECAIEGGLGFVANLDRDFRDALRRACE